MSFVWAQVLDLNRMSEVSWFVVGCQPVTAKHEERQIRTVHTEQREQMCCIGLSFVFWIPTSNTINYPIGSI